MRILITGGAGCLGTNLIEHWLPQGHHIFVIDNFSTSHRSALPEHPRLCVVEGSIAVKEFVVKIISEFQPEIIINSAAAYKDPSNWVEDIETNTIGMAHLIASAQQVSVKRFINFQTALCYGNPKKTPISINAPTAPFTSYGISKTAGEAYLAASSLPYVSFRLANVTGPRLSIGPIPTFYTRLKAGKSCFCSDTYRDFLDMRDFLSLMDIALKINAPTGIYNVSTGKGNSIKDIFDVVVQHLGLTLSEPVKVIRPGDDDIQTVILDPSETEKAFSWKAEISFEETISDMLKWYDKHDVKAIYSHLNKPGNDTNE